MNLQCFRNKFRSFWKSKFQSLGAVFLLILVTSKNRLIWNLVKDLYQLYKFSSYQKFKNLGPKKSCLNLSYLYFIKRDSKILSKNCLKLIKKHQSTSLARFSFLLCLELMNSIIRSLNIVANLTKKKDRKQIICQ